MELFGFQLLVIFSVFFETSFFGILPLFTFKNVTPGGFRERALPICNAFSGGIFLSGGFIHLLGEAQEALNEELETELPVALLLCSFGFLGTFFLEQVVCGGHSHSHSLEDPSYEEFHPQMKSQNQKRKKRQIGEETSLVMSTKVKEAECCNKDAKQVDHTSPDGSEDEHQHHHQKHQHSTPSNIIAPSQMLFFILSVHSFTSAIALGVQTTVEKALPLYIAILSHKWVESFAVGVSLVRTDTPRRKAITMMLLYSSMTSIGVIIGSAASSFVKDERTSILLEAAGGAIAAGIFIYVAAIDVIMEEFSHNSRDKYWKSFSCLLGFLIMTGFLFVIPHDHSHEETEVTVAALSTLP